jgi:hypothetical protein
MPAMEALVRVDMTPDNSAEIATFAIRPLRPGASCDKTPIWIPTDEMLPKPQTAYVAMRRERSEISTDPSVSVVN